MPVSCRTTMPLFISIVLALPLTSVCRADKLDDVKARGRLIVGVSETSPPFSSREGQDGIVGYDVDLAERVARRLGVAMEKLPITSASFRPAIWLTWAMPLSRRIRTFSVAYLVSPHKVLIRRDSGIAQVSQMAGRKLALVRSASVDAELKAAVHNL